jgi:hypothetical protein
MNGRWREHVPTIIEQDRRLIKVFRTFAGGENGSMQS